MCDYFIKMLKIIKPTENFYDQYLELNYCIITYGLLYKL